ncbi:tRNA-dependent cyclodipeptide synthase [Microbacteriaceae bacterium 4G12]
MVVAALEKFEIDYLSENSKLIYENKAHITLGISPFTSKYCKDYIDKLITWANENFANITILLAGKESVNILESLGVSELKASRKVRKELNRQKRFCEESLIKNNRDTNCIYTFSDFEDNNVYQNLYKKISICFNNDSYFKESCLKMSEQAMKSKAKNMNVSEDIITKEKIEYAAKYVLAELPFFLNAAPIFNVKETILSYHTDWELGKKINNNEFDLKLSDTQGYITLKDRRE